mmetsp:Transcript_11659/g.16660  ORF Transcript_11659/g.16660 Transcript_11659/m.16660 type:complete len:470 (-) Transcript_11659:153-1562(-)
MRLRLEHGAIVALVLLLTASNVFVTHRLQQKEEELHKARNELRLATVTTSAAASSTSYNATPCPTTNSHAELASERQQLQAPKVIPIKPGKEKEENNAVKEVSIAKDKSSFTVMEAAKKRHLVPYLAHACYECVPGGKADGGTDLDKNGICRDKCSQGGFCGSSQYYQGTDCRTPCSGPACSWQLGTPQHLADSFWITNKLIPFDTTTRRFHLKSTPCADPKEIWIDVGAHSASLVPHQGIVFAFEPQLWLFQQVLKQSQSTSKGQCIFPIPAAASPGPPSFQVFHTSSNFHSSSLLKVDAVAADQYAHLNHNTTNWKEVVSQTHENGGVLDFSVLTISLEDVIMRLPPCRRVDFLKIDAQGFDLNVAQSAGRWIQVVDKVEIESPGDNVVPLYAGSPTKQQIVAWFEEHGFKKTREETACCLDKILEVNIFFENMLQNLVVGHGCPHPSGATCAPITLDQCHGELARR